MANNDEELVFTPPETYQDALYEHDKYKIFATYFAPYMKGVTHVQQRNPKWNIKTPAGKEVLFDFGKECHCLNNGMCFYMMNHGTNYFYLGVDLNGQSGPNRAGRDVFYFALHFTNNGITVDEKTYGYNKMTNLYEGYTDSSGGGCNKTDTKWSNGATCTAIIMHNNWKIPADYPW